MIKLLFFCSTNVYVVLSHCTVNNVKHLYYKDNVNFTVLTCLYICYENYKLWDVANIFYSTVHEHYRQYCCHSECKTSC